MKKIFSFILSLIILTGNVGLTYGTHYCGGHAVESKLLLGIGDMGCGMEEEVIETCAFTSKDITFRAKKCCENKYETLEVNIDYKVDIQKLKWNYDLIVGFPEINLIESQSFEVSEDRFVAHSPPLLKENFQVLFQTFLFYDMIIA